MTLQKRLVLTLLGTILPLLLGGLWLRAEFFRRAGEQTLLQIVDARLEMIGQERCEADPAQLGRPGWAIRRPPGEWNPPLREPGEEPPPVGRFPRRGRGPGPPRDRPREGRPRLFAYDASYRAALAEAPPFPQQLQEKLQGGDASAALDSETPEGRRLQVAVRTGWDQGRCAVVLAELEMPPSPKPLRALLLPTLVLSGVLLFSVWLAAGPVVRRIRRLTEAVRRSSADHYASPVPEEGRDEVGELSRAFNEAGRSIREHVMRLERREETLRSFLANTTHDVMLPLTVLQGHLATLRRRADAGEAVSPGDVQAAMEEAQYMASLLHNLSAAAKLETDEALIESQPVELGALVERVVARHRTLAASRGIALEHAVPEGPLHVRGDVTLLEQAVGNVVHNAVRYNRDGGHVAVVLERRGDGKRFELRVLDDGPGVPEGALPHLTERRFRGDAARTRQPGGLGLGLHIARDVAERHGLELRVSNAEEGGLLVTFSGSVETSGQSDSET